MQNPKSDKDRAGAARDERSELFERQEAEMRKTFDLPPEWRMDDLVPKKPKRTSE